MKIGDRIYVRGYIDEIRKYTVIVRNDGGYFRTVLSEVTGELPSAQPKRGKWIWNGDTLDWERLHYCSECKKYALRDTDGKYEVLSVFCPHCGAKMER